MTTPDPLDLAAGQKWSSKTGVIVEIDRIYQRVNMGKGKSGLITRVAGKVIHIPENPGKSKMQKDQPFDLDPNTFRRRFPIPSPLNGCATTDEE